MKNAVEISKVMMLGLVTYFGEIPKSLMPKGFEQAGHKPIVCSATINDAVKYSPSVISEC